MRYRLKKKLVDFVLCICLKILNLKKRENMLIIEKLGGI